MNVNRNIEVIEPGAFEIYTTGAYLRPFKTNEKKWVWVVERFDEDSFFADVECSPVELAATQDGLLASDLKAVNTPQSAIERARLV